MTDKEIAEIGFLPPTEYNSFIEENLGNDEYNITFGMSFIRVRIKKEADGSVVFNVLENVVKTPYSMQKLIGYVMLNLVVRYSDKK